jgi:thioredoxin reductase (NADPH)
MSDIDVVIVGGGVAGSSAALTAARFGLRTVMLAPDGPMGALAAVDRIEGAPGLEDVSGYDLCPTLHAQAVEAGTEVRPLSATAIARNGEEWELSCESDTVSARTVIIASGTTGARLEVPGEAELQGRGVSDCASCDGPIFRGMDVAVIGGGDSALQETLTLLDHRVGVTLVQLQDAFTAQDTYVSRVAAKRSVKVRFHTRVLEILGGERVSGVRLLDESTQSVEEIAVGGVFVYVGRNPVTSWLTSLHVLDETGHVVTDSTLATSESGLFAAGDVRAGSPGQATTAMGDGVSAATAAYRYLSTVPR